MVECSVNLLNLFPEQERKRPNSVLAELASVKNMPPTFTATVEINGTSYTGTPANSLKEAANKAAFEAIWATDPHYCIALSHDSEQLAEKPHASKSVSMTPDDNLTFNHQLLGGTESRSDESGPGKFNVKDASGPEKVSEKTEMEDPAEQIHNQPQQDPLPVQQRHLKTETGYVYQYPRSEEIQGRQQSCQEVDLAESINKRRIIKSENAEQMSQRTKKHKGKKRTGTASHKRECIVKHLDV